LKDKVKFNEFITLKSIDLTVRRGELVAIIGEVGSGKSSIISSIIGDMIYVDDETLSIYKQNEISS
jgi:ABC-type glutathione transport system ATPase component